MTYEQNTPDHTPASAVPTPAPAAVSVDAGSSPHYGVGPFSIREVAVLGVALVALIISFFPLYSGFSLWVSVWSMGPEWILMIALPVAAAVLIALRRLSPQAIRRVGSLSIDQFASVAFSVAAALWFSSLWSGLMTTMSTTMFGVSWVVWVEVILMIAGVVLTVFAPLIPVLSDDFQHRTQVAAHRVASPARPIIARPRPVQPVAAPAYGTPAPAYGAPAPAYGAPAPAYAPPAEAVAPEVVAPETSAPVEAVAPVDANETQAIAPLVDQVSSAAPASQAFWALAPVERTVVDESGAPLFTVGPTAWALVIEDRGDTFVVRADDGRVGYLTDVTDVTRG